MSHVVGTCKQPTGSSWVSVSDLLVLSIVTNSQIIHGPWQENTWGVQVDVYFIRDDHRGKCILLDSVVL